MTSQSEQQHKHSVHEAAPGGEVPSALTVDAPLANVPGAEGSEPELGDTVRHIPSGELWLVAYVADGMLCACGWPDELVPVADCELVSRLPLHKKLDLLRDLSRSSGRRAAHAQRLLWRACLAVSVAEPAAIGAATDSARGTHCEPSQDGARPDEQEHRLHLLMNKEQTQ